LNPGRRGGKLATNRLSYGAAKLDETAEGVIEDIHYFGR
jgi:hypothetical protein